MPCHELTIQWKVCERIKRFGTHLNISSLEVHTGISKQTILEDFTRFIEEIGDWIGVLFVVLEKVEER